MKIAYTGKADVRVLTADDFKKFSEVEGFKKTSFNKGETVEVTDEIGQALLDNTRHFGEFTEVTEGDEPAEAFDANASAEQTPENAGAADDATTARGTRSRGTTGTGTVAASTSRSA